MEFIKNLKETNDSKAVGKIMPFDEDLTYRKFIGFQFGNIWLSIQASYGHYCTPRKTLKDINEYTAMEFALMNKEGFISVSDALPNFTRLKEIEEYEDTVYGYVPVELIEELYQELSATFGKAE
jgi:hypothetical protein